MVGRVSGCEMMVANGSGFTKMVVSVVVKGEGAGCNMKVRKWLDVR